MNKKNKNMKIIIFTVLALYFLFIWDYEITYSRKGASHKIEYQGLLWVILDKYSINKYNSSDTPMSWIKHTKSYKSN